jgi:putative hydroxymethylpyrimidine transport system substrate-binding protein
MRKLRQPNRTALAIARRQLMAATGLAVIHSSSLARRVAAKDAVSIALDWYPNSNHAGLFWAESRGLFSDAGLDVTLQTPADPSTVLQTVAAGRDTFGISYQPDILLARAEGVPVVAVASIVPRPLLGVMSLASSNITRPADLAGKTVGYPGIPSQEAFLKTMLAGDGLTLDDVNLIDVEFNLIPSVISGKAVAVMGAYWTHETIAAKNEGYLVTLLKVDDWGVPGYDELVLVASEDTVANQTDMVRDAIDAIVTGYRDASNDQAAALDILQQASSDIDLAVEIEGLALLADVWKETGTDLGKLDQARWQAFVDWMIEQALLPATFDITGTLFASSLTSSSATPEP